MFFVDFLVINIWKHQEWKWQLLQMHNFAGNSWSILLMAEILHQFVDSLSHYLQGFIHSMWLNRWISEPSTVWTDGKSRRKPSTSTPLRSAISQVEKPGIPLWCGPKLEDPPPPKKKSEWDFFVSKWTKAFGALHILSTSKVLWIEWNQPSCSLDPYKCYPVYLRSNS